ncbi:MAG TPA: DNA topoisomerase I, partial [Armatimonadetes bacterium]|nr:DNA topoisomerase I [Armatimonadota bacterium]
YMRTDSTRVAQQAQKEARQFIEQTFGPSYRPSKPRRTRPKKGAQDAHEAIRPTSVFRRPEEVKPYLTAEQYRLYALIWETFVASQMSPAILHVVTVDIAAGPYTFRARGTTVKFPGFLALTGEPEPAKEGNGEGEELNKVLPPLSEGQSLTLLNLEPQQHFTKPPPRYTEAALVKALEEEGIGRPSTYAQILGNIVERGYVVLKKRRFHPTPLGFTVTDQLVRHFPDIMDVKFTAAMEEKLDRIERGEADWVAVLREFYGPFEEALRQAERNMQRVEAPKPQPTEVPCPECGAPMVIRQGRYGEFLSCSTFPRCKGTRPLNQDQPPAPRPSGEVCEKCGAEMVIRTNRRGEEFLGCSAYPKCRNTRSLPQERFPCPTPKCSGYLVPRRGPRGRFYGCSRYPECTFTTPYRPTEQTCPQCGWPLGQRRRRGEVEAYVCVNRECGYTAPAAAEEVGEVVA